MDFELPFALTTGFELIFPAWSKKLYTIRIKKDGDQWISNIRLPWRGASNSFPSVLQKTLYDKNKKGWGSMDSEPPFAKCMIKKNGQIV